MPSEKVATPESSPLGNHRQAPFSDLKCSTYCIVYSTPFSKNAKQMCFLLLLIREMQNKTIRYHFALIRKAES